ncbi:hypothetical protein HYV57_00990 [Candidatus Peregrinibacteria bacterium]|nr:hypothetical protein [Candidatus Peregrinibacteria bacterium]
MNQCKQCKNSFEIRDFDQAFYTKINVPAPKNCPDCRLIRRFMERNPKNLSYRKCDFSGKQILSQYHKDQPFPVYSSENWWSDHWDPLSFGRAFDLEQPFFEQFLELKRETPHRALFNTMGTIQNSDYNNCTAYIKNCYLIAESDYCEDCYFSNLLKKCTSVVDCSVCYEDQLCYECIDCTNCYQLFYSQDCQNSTSSYFLKHCSSCADCIGCINQRHKQYMIFNKQYSKEEYEKHAFALHANAGVEQLSQKCDQFFITQPYKSLTAEQNEQSSGDHLFHSKNAFHCFDSMNLEDCAYCAKLSLGVKSSMDYNSWGNQSELMYQCSSSGDNCYNLKFCVHCEVNMSDSEYCIECFSCSNCFGCVGLKKERFCILNKQYSESDYHLLKGKIIEHMRQTGEWGEFFPIAVCPFGYNETLAMDAFPLTQKQALDKGFTWHEEVKYEPKLQTYVMPESIFDADESVTKEFLQCKCGKNFKIISQEFSFYQKLHIPLPHNCPLCRHKTRMSKRKPLTLWERTCMKCHMPIQTNYAPDRPETVYCEACYLKEVY